MDFYHLTKSSDLFTSALFFMPSILFLFLARRMKLENEAFANARPCEGRIVDLTSAGSDSGCQFPTVEYMWGAERRTFESTLSIVGATVGQFIDIEINQSGHARLRSAENNRWLIFMNLLTGLGFFGAVIHLIYQLN